MWEKYSNGRINLRKRIFTIGNDNEYCFFVNGEIADKSNFSAEFGDAVRYSGADSAEEARCLKEYIRKKYRDTSKDRYGSMSMLFVMLILMGIWTAMVLWRVFDETAFIAVLAIAIDALFLFMAVLAAIGAYRINVTEKRFFTNFKVTSYEFAIDEIIRFSVRSENAKWLIRFGGSNYLYVSSRPNLPFERGDIFTCDVAENGDKILLFWTNGNAGKMWNWGYRVQR